MKSVITGRGRKFIGTSKSHNIERKIVMTNDIGKLVNGCPPRIALIARNKEVILRSPGALSNITPFT